MGDDMSNTNRTIRIVGVPPGEAPFWVREQWVGLELPLTRHPAPRAFFAFGVLSSPRTWLPQWWEIVRGRAARIPGYPVDPSSGRYSRGIEPGGRGMVAKEYLI